ncbi:hypothetical protein TNCV_4110741 [Trichonephila clavipes]|nr:hypothetical protein TNCV_4110741 [Trichonephila clavipes]
MVAQRLTQIIPPAAPPDQLWQRVEAAWSAEPQEHIRMQEETTDRLVRSPPPHFTTTRDNRRIVYIAVLDCAATSRTTEQHIQSVSQHSVSDPTIRRRLQHPQSVHGFVNFLLETPGVNDANGAMNGGHGLRMERHCFF